MSNPVGWRLDYDNKLYIKLIRNIEHLIFKLDAGPQTEESPLDAVDPREVTWSICDERTTPGDEDDRKIRLTRRTLFESETERTGTKDTK